MDLTALMICLIFVILIANGGCAAIGEVKDGTNMRWNTMSLPEKKAIKSESEKITRRRRFLDVEDLTDMREKSYIHTPQEFLQHFGPQDDIDVYDIFRKLYLEAFQFEEQPTNSVTDQKLLEMGDEFVLSRCRKPRMKIIDLYDELGIPQEIIISPPAANVSRCGDNSGCCPKGKRCYHTGDNFKNKTITVLYIEGNDISVKKYSLLEHEECECTTLTPSSSSALPTVGDYNTSPFICHKRCVSFFKQDAYCQCNVCDPEKYNSCHRLMKGKRSLPPTEAICVDIGECEEPICAPELTYSYEAKMCIKDEEYTYDPLIISG